KNGVSQGTPNVISGKNVQPLSKTIKVQSHSPITPKKKLAKQPIIQNKNKAIMPTNKNQKTNASTKQKQSGSSKTKVRVAQHTSSKRTSKSIKPQLLSSSTKTTKKQTNTTKINKNIKTQTLSTTTKKQKTKKLETKPIGKQAKASKSVNVIPKTSQKTSKISNYYNQASKTWSSKLPGSDNVRDFGQTTEASGINDALKIMKKSGNKGVTL